MLKVNDNFTKLPSSYLFSEIARRVDTFAASHSGEKIIRMGIGDVTRPLCSEAIRGMEEAVRHEADAATFRGYGPEQGHLFLREKIVEFDYAARGIDIRPDEVFVSDGAKSDTGNIGDIISTDCRVAVTDPVYPVYVDTNVMSGRAGDFDSSTGKWSRIEYLSCNDSNSFIPSLPKNHPDIIYLCYPNNPTGTTLTRRQLKEWVDYARANGAVILFDSAYEAYISESDVPHSIYEIEGAKEVAIEFRSFSKTAGFTGVRCGYTVVPHDLKGIDSSGKIVEVNSLWNRRQTTKFNGASYISQRAAEALYSPEGQKQVKETIAYYMTNAAMLRDGLAQAGIECRGGINAPYIWLKTPGGLSSWDFFDIMLKKCHLVGTPGVGFGPSGEGYFRLTAFSSHEATLEAVKRIERLAEL
ncbi:MAG: LL-diaminopimelate aminotransferase [Paramuribaculum sp.]|nr:LL-diaminopimelate aminotransferase [Paramuribaculum sp.]